MRLFGVLQEEDLRTLEGQDGGVGEHVLIAMKLQISIFYFFEKLDVIHMQKILWI